MAVYCAICKTSFSSEKLAQEHQCQGMPLLNELLDLMHGNASNMVQKVETIRKRARLFRVRQLKEESKRKAEKAQLQQQAQDLISFMLDDEAQAFNSSQFFGKFYSYNVVCK